MLVVTPVLSVSLLCSNNVNMFCPVVHIRRGLITRNIKEAVDIFHERFGVSLIFFMRLTANYNYNLQLSVRFLICRLAAVFLSCYDLELE